jgi:hypothetical protein
MALSCPFSAQFVQTRQSGPLALASGPLAGIAPVAADCPQANCSLWIAQIEEIHRPDAVHLHDGGSCAFVVIAQSLKGD